MILYLAAVTTPLAVVVLLATVAKVREIRGDTAYLAVRMLAGRREALRLADRRVERRSRLRCGLGICGCGRR